MKKNKKGIDAKPAKRLTSSSSSSSGGVRAANEANPHRVKEERFPPAAVQTMPLNQAAVTLTGGVGGLSLGPAVGRGGLEDVEPLPHIVSALFLSFPPLLSPSVASVCSRLWRVCVAGLTAPPFVSTFPITSKSCGRTNLRFHVPCSPPSRRSRP